MDKTKGNIKKSIGNYVKDVLVAVVHFLRLRCTAKKFNIYTEKLDNTRNDSYWLGYDNKIYFGHPIAIFFLSEQNRWWLDKKELN